MINFMDNWKNVACSRKKNYSITILTSLLCWSNSWWLFLMGGWQPKRDTLPFLFIICPLWCCFLLPRPTVYFLYAFYIFLKNVRNNQWIFALWYWLFEKDNLPFQRMNMRRAYLSKWTDLFGCRKITNKIIKFLIRCPQITLLRKKGESIRELILNFRTSILK